MEFDMKDAACYRSVHSFLVVFMQQEDRIKMKKLASYSETAVRAKDMGRLCGLPVGVRRNPRPNPALAPINTKLGRSKI